MTFALCILSAPGRLPAQPSLTFLSATQSEVFSDSLLRLTVAPLLIGAKASDSCDLFHGPTPAGNRLEGHPVRMNAKRSLSKDSATVAFEFRPAENEAGKTGAQLGLGFHYVVASCREGKQISPEIPIWVVSRQAASILSPKAQEASFSPDISWTPVPGVPAYHLLLSDQALEINTQKGTISGASVIWQVITTKTAIAYGTPDPSGTFAKVPAPPLSPNVPYNLVVLNNYDGRSALATSSKAQGLKLFTLQVSGPSPKAPRNLEPAQDRILTASRDSAITFKWAYGDKAGSGGAGAANTYRIFIYSLEGKDRAEALIPIWHTEVTDTFAVLDAKRTLLSKRYVWKVFAVGESGASVVSDTTSFQYRNDVQTLSLSVKSAGLAGDTLPLGDVLIAVTPLDGSADPLPFFTNNSGGAERVLAVGGYSLAFSKNGYATQFRTVSLGLSDPVNLVQILPEASCRITGRAADKAGAGLVNAQVTASGGGRTVQSITDAQGFFLLGVAAGTHSLSVSKPDYQSLPDTTLVLEAGASADLGRLILEKATASLTGKVANDKGAALAGCPITVKNAAGAVERNLLTDDKGAFSAYLAPGAYVVIAARAGFASEQKTVQLTAAANLGFILTPGASLVKGRVSLLTWPTAAASQSTPLPGAAVELIHASRGSQKAETDLRGEFSLSADTGAYLLKAALPGKARPESVQVRIVATRSTVSQDLSLRGFASIQGVIRLSPDTVVDPSAVSVSLLSPITSGRIASATPQPAAEAGASGAMAYSLDGIPDGEYLLACGLAGYGLDAEQAITVQDAIWRTGQDLTLKKAVKSITFAMTVDGEGAPGTIRLITPQAAEIPAGRKLDQAASGTYTLNAFPGNQSVIPLARFAFFLSAAGPEDTTVTLEFPFSHLSGPLAIQDGEAELILEARAPLDSAFLIYGYGEPVDTLKVSASQLSGSKGPRAFRFRPGPQGGPLTYYFVLHAGSRTYSNQEPSRRFRARVTASPDLSMLKLAAADTLRLPAHARGEIHLHAYDAAGLRLDSALDERGTFAWRADAALGIRLAGGSKRTLNYATAAPSGSEVVLGKRGAGAAASWGTLSVTVGLDGVEKTLGVPVKVVSATVNKLVLGSALGEAADIPDPASFELFVSGYDTTTTPPTPVLPNPLLTLDPPQAGSVSEMRVALDPYFIGPLRVLARQVNADGSEAATELGAYRDSLARGLNVGQTLIPGDTARRLFHDPLFQLYVPDSAFSNRSQIQLRVYKRRVAKTFSSGLVYSVTGGLYEVSNPSGAVFTSPPRLTLGLPATARGRKNSLQRFDTGKLAWMAPTDSVLPDTNVFAYPALSTRITELDGSYYGLLSASRPLTAGEVQITPNPFSPLVLASRDGNTQYGARIRLHPESDRSPEVTVSVKIYNLDGELVRLLVDHKTVPKTPVDFYWDGKADGGRWARNGRYLLKVSVGATGSSSQKHTLRPVVLFQ